MPNCGCWDVALGMHVVAVTAKCDQVDCLCATAIFHPDHMVQLQSQYIPAGWIRALITRLTKNFVSHRRWRIAVHGWLAVDCGRGLVQRTHRTFFPVTPSQQVSLGSARS